MPKKKKQEDIEDIMERMEEDLNKLRHMVWDMQCENKSSDDEDELDFDDEDNDEEEDE